MKYPTPDLRLTTCRYRVDAKPWDTETDARAAIMEYLMSHPSDQCSMREYRGDGIYVYVTGGGGSRWLSY